MRSMILKAMLLVSAIAVAAAVVTMFAVVRVPERVDIVYAATNVDLDQCANLTTPCSWQNGNLNGNNSAYSEGDVVPFRLAIEGLDAGSHTIHINYDFTSGGNKAYDFLATYDASESVDLCAVGGGAVSSFCPSLPSASTMAFPADSFVADGLPVSGAETFSGVGRDLTIFGGTITGITAPAHAGSLAGNSTGDIVVTFTSSGSAVLLVWGGHIAQSGYWDVAGGGSADGASLVSGAPWHMRTQQLDGGGNSNQDRSIQPSAIVEAPTPTPTSTPTSTPVTPTATPVTPTATPVTPTATPVTPTATPV
ncbi:MAG: hypothetical protein IIC88_03815, partial [Chloroflexi bacterium]|nr:hypothetical protein [Chloroflexota bacterium]